MSARGERFFEAGEREIRVMFTNRALVEAERLMGRSVFGVARGLLDGQSGVTEIAALLRAGMEAARRDARERPVRVSSDEAMDILDEAGVTVVATALMEAITAVLSYDGSEAGDGDEEPDPN